MKMQSMMIRLRRLALSVAIVQFPLQALAQDAIVLDEQGAQEYYIGTKKETGREISLLTGESKVLDARGVGKVFVSNPDVAKVNIASVRGHHYMVLTGKKAGYCDLVRFGSKGPLERLTVRVSSSEIDASTLNREIKKLLPESTVHVANEEHGLVMRGNVQNKTQMDALLQLLSKYTNAVENEVIIGKTKQIKLQARIIELSRTKLKEAGINLLGIGASATAGVFTAGSLSSYTAGRGTFTNIESISPYSEAFQLLLGVGDISSVLSILESKGISKTLSNPSVTTEDSKAAKLFVGGSIPIPVPQTGTNVVTIEWKDYGIKLDFVPNVTEKGAIALKVHAEAGDLSEDKGVSIAGTKVPAVTTRSVDSEVTLNEGEDLVIAGLMFSKDQNTVEGVPLLSDIPVIGAFFQKVYDSHEDLELVVVIQPYFVSADTDQNDYEGKLAPLEPMKWSDYLMGRANDRIE